jgi:hypothetical protein
MSSLRYLSALILFGTVVSTVINTVAGTVAEDTAPNDLTSFMHHLANYVIEFMLFVWSLILFMKAKHELRRIETEVRAHCRVLTVLQERIPGTSQLLEPVDSEFDAPDGASVSGNAQCGPQSSDRVS